MFKGFSWGDFLLFAAALNLLWYGYVLLVVYRKPLVSGAGEKRFGAELRSGAKPQDFEKEEETEGGMMGKARLPEGVQVLGSNQVAFSAADEDGRYDQVGLVADVVQELKLIFSELESGAGEKKDFFRSLAKLKEDYGPLGGHPSISAINNFIVSRAGFHLSADEIDNLWY